MRCLAVGNVCIRIPAKVLGKDDLTGAGAHHRECIAYEPPPRLSIQAKAVPKVMDESNQHHPGGRPSMRMASEVCKGCSIWVRSVSGSLSSARVQGFRCLPNALLAAR